MDAGAHFHCCDIQVHSPRDLYWVGTCPVSEAERNEFAQEFVQACRTKGLDAIALTDHHDLGFLRYIQGAARAEPDANGNPVTTDKQIVIFPGVELTLGLPCQALLLFDPNVEPETLERTLAALGIEPAAHSAPKTKPVERLPINDLVDLVKRLNQLESIRNRFILLPNVNDGGQDTILRSGFFHHYANMPCVGGYVDGDFVGHSRKLILEGKDPAWGPKRLGVVQTSDSRERSFERLGQHATWIKWSIASTEAIRQACLAPASRLRYSVPALPDHWISKIEVSDSKYFGPLSVEFNRQANAIIGGRGSGKSTILEYLRWALCDQPYVHHEENGYELPDYERRRRSLIKTTLGPSGATVVVHYFRNGVLHRIRRDGASGAVFLQVADGPEVETTEETIQSLANIQGYSQKQLSHVSVRAQELIRLLTTPIARELTSLSALIETKASNLRQLFERLESSGALYNQIQAIKLELTSEREQANVLTDSIRNLPPELSREIELHPDYLSGERLAERCRSSMASAIDMITSSRSSLQKLLDEIPGIVQGQPANPLATLIEQVRRALRQTMQALQDQEGALVDVKNSLAPLLGAVAEDIKAHKERYQQASSEDATIQHHVQALREVSERIDALVKEKDVLSRKFNDIGDVASDLAAARAEWSDLVVREIELLEEQAHKLTKDSGESLRVVVRRWHNTEPLKVALLDAVRGAAITTPEKFEALLQQMSGPQDTIAAWLQLGEELIALARVGPHLSAGATLPITPRMTMAGFIHSELRRIATKLTPVSAFHLTLLYPKSVPVFEYKTADGNFIPFEEASPGQQATALMNLLLNQSAGPLLIDQPEDDLDTSTILSVAARLWEAKEKRQLIITTHNPNLVVIGDAELIVHCDYSQPLQSARVYIAKQGAIDGRDICEMITKVMEGGAEAFKLRKDKYGF